MGLFDPNIKQLEAKRDMAGLIKALNYKKSYQVRMAAADALGRIKNVQAVESLIAALEDVPDVMRSVAGALGEIGDARAVEPLMAKLIDINGHVDRKMMDGLCKIGAPAVGRLITQLKDGNKFNRDGFMGGLAQIGAPAVEPLIAALQDSEINIRLAAIGVLVKIRDTRAVDPLISMLHDSEPGVRLTAADALAKIADVRAVEPLIAMLHDSEPVERFKAAETLAKFADVRAIEPLIAALHDSDPRVRFTAADALAEFADVRAVEPLIAALQDSQAAVCEHAALALGKIGDTHAVEPLIDMLYDSKIEVRSLIAKALDALKWEPDNGQTGAYYWVAKREWNKCFTFGALAIAPLIDVLIDYDVHLPTVNTPASDNARDLAKVYNAVENRLQELKTKERNGAANTLIQIDGPAMERTIAVLKMKDNYLRQHVVEALKKSHWDPSISKTIQAALQQSDLKRDSECYYGLSVVDGNEIKYNGPLIKIEESGDEIPSWVQNVFQNKPSSHFLISPQMGMMIIILSASDFQGMQFTSPMSKEVAAQFLSSMMNSKTVRMVEQFGAIELQGDKIANGLSKEKISSPVKEPPAQVQKGESASPASESRLSPSQQEIGKTQSMSTPPDYSRYTKAFIYCRQGFNPSTLRLPGFTGKAEVIRSGSIVANAEIVAYMLMEGCDEDYILVSPPDYGVGFKK